MQQIGKKYRYAQFSIQCLAPFLLGFQILETEFYGKYSILYNRGIYPEESFAKVKKYGLPMLLTQDEGVKSFITNLTSQLSGTFLFAACPCCGFFLRCSEIFFFSLFFFIKNGWRQESYRGLFLWSWAKLHLKFWRDGISVSKLIARSLKRGIFPIRWSFLGLSQNKIECSISSLCSLFLLGFQFQGFQGEEWQGNHERDSSYHATDCVLHYLLAMPGWTLLVFFFFYSF